MLNILLCISFLVTGPADQPTASNNVPTVYTTSAKRIHLPSYGDLTVMYTPPAQDSVICVYQYAINIDTVFFREELLPSAYKHLEDGTGLNLKADMTWDFQGYINDNADTLVFPAFKEALMWMVLSIKDSTAAELQTRYPQQITLKDLLPFTEIIPETTFYTRYGTIAVRLFTIRAEPQMYSK